ncbi:MAG: hypothetical protein RIC55_20405 [Pirellulaceae bacterium]
MNMRPGGELAARELHFLWIVDCSGSMGVDGKIEELNNAIDEALPGMREVAADNPNAQLLIRAIRFSNGAQWHVLKPVAIEEFQWEPLSADGVTDLGAALAEVAEQLSIERMPQRALPPVLVLISDGQPTDDYKAGLKKLLGQPWGAKAVRIAIAIGRDADHGPLQEFIGNIEFKPLQANNAERLAQLIKWASTAVVKAASAPSSQVVQAGPVGNVPIPEPPVESGESGVDDVW